VAERSVGQQLWPGLDMRPEDSIVRKYPFSAFRSGALDLPDLLYARGFDAVLIAGLATEVCCGSSARDAMIQNFPHRHAERCECSDDPRTKPASLLA